MLIPFSTLAKKYDFTPSGGVLHVGAHEGEEADDYDAIGFNPVYWVEADHETAHVLERNVGKRPGHHVIASLLADEERIVTFHQANNGQSSSILELGTHATEHPDVVYVGEQERHATTVDALLEFDLIERCAFLNLDVQGAELLVLKGATEFLSTVDFIYAEVNKRKLYKDCALIGDIDHYVGMLGFVRAETAWTRHGWGDALYVREQR
jgi:FkbM family methyltransferase